MLKVVSNTTPLISLLKLSKIEILKDLYSEIVIPRAVYKEFKAGKDKEFYQDLSRIKWIKIKDIKDELSVKYFLDLDAGEAETIILASEIEADTVILDEKLGRIYAKHAGLKVTGTIGVLVKAKKEGLIDQVKPLLMELTEKGVWINERLIAEVCKIVDE
ncbi:MAG: DUF3368 domain-containing protein [Prolixibacteraceae bacterium]|nr:DUF3368 domain-containing protein [Prolixibacteraceae bacterium]